MHIVTKMRNRIKHIQRSRLIPISSSSVWKQPFTIVECRHDFLMALKAYSELFFTASYCTLSAFVKNEDSEVRLLLSKEKNNRFPILDILGYLKNTHKNPKFGKVRQVPTREFPTKFPDWDLSHSSKFGIFVGILQIP